VAPLLFLLVGSLQNKKAQAQSLGLDALPLLILIVPTYLFVIDGSYTKGTRAHTHRELDLRSKIYFSFNI